MPPVIIAAGAAAAGGYVAGLFAAGSILGAVAGAFTASIVAGIGASVFGLNRPGQSFASETQDRQVMVRSAIEPRRVVYGEVGGLSGPLVFAHVTREYDHPVRRYTAIIPRTAPYTISLASRGWYADERVDFWEDTGSGADYAGQLTSVASAPAASQYSVADGLYTFNASDAGRQVVIQHRITGAVTNSFFHLVIPLAGHEVEEIGDVRLGADTITAAMLDAGGNVSSGKYAGFVRIKKHLGSADQEADADLIAESEGKWTEEHRGRGIAYVYVRLRRNPDLFPAGVPNITATVKGKKLYDPRTGTTAWSNNWALVVYDYLTSSYGLGCAAAEVNTTAINAAANVCDEDVEIDADANTQKRYTADGTLALDARPLDVLKALLTAGAGGAVYSVDTWDVYAGAYTAPTASLTVSDLRGPLAGRADVERRELFNGVRGTFVDPDRDWQTTDFPAVTNDTYVADDNGEEVFRDIDLPFTTDVIRAQRIAKIFLERARQAVQCTWPGKPKLFGLNTWETVNVTVDALGWDPKVFRVLAWTWAPGGGVDLVLQEEAAAIYDWNFGEASTVDLADNTNLPLAGRPSAPGAPVVSEEVRELREGVSYAVVAMITCDASPDGAVTYYRFEYKSADATDWTVLPLETAPTKEIVGIEAGVYDFRVAAINDFGQVSLYSETRAAITGLAAKPADVTGFYVTVHEGRARIHVDKSPDADVRIGGRLWIRHTAQSVGGEWINGVLIKEDGYPGDSVVVEGPLYAGTYMAKFEDSTHQFSDTEATFVVTEALLSGFTTLSTATFDPDFAGTKVNVVTVDSGLQLVGATLWDDIPGNMDDWTIIDSNGGIVASGSCTFDSKIDLGSVQTVRLFPSLQTFGIETGDLWDGRTDLMDSWGEVDGAIIDDAEIQPQVRVTNDDPNGASPTWGPWHNLEVADYTARGFEFRTLHTSGNVTHNRRLTAFSVAAKQQA